MGNFDRQSFTMSQGNGVPLALALAALVVVTFGYGTMWGATYQPSPEVYPSYQAVPSPSGASIRSGTPCLSPHDLVESDLCAQWKAAYAAERSAWWASIAGWFGGLGFFAVAAAVVLSIQSNSIARDTARRQLRAYIAIDKLKFVKPDPLDDRLIVRLQYQNYGETPALNVYTQFRAEFVVGTDPRIPIAAPSRQPGGSSGYLAKNIKERNFDEVGVVVDGVHTSGHSESMMREMVAIGEAMIFAHGWIIYEDVFGARYHVDFKWLHDWECEYVGREFVIAHDGNDVGLCERCERGEHHLHSPLTA